MRKMWVGGNWKMHGSLAQNPVLLAEMQVPNEIDCAIFPAQMHLVSCQEAAHERIEIGAQMISTEEQGAFTGQISAAMVKEAGLTLCMIGHSESRELLGDTDQRVATKIKLALETTLLPVICIGEQLDARENGQTEAVLAEQIDAFLPLLDEQSDIIIAYEPVWAIGTGKAATPEMAQQTHAFIRAKLAECSEAFAQKTRIVYGGSVKPDNAAEIFSMKDIDGALVGGASLDSASFNAILEHAATTN